MHHVLFICTGNYYRSRFAEAVFNHLARQHRLNWRAFSRGLAIHLAPEDGLSIHTRAALAARGIPEEHTATAKAPVTEQDLRRADLRIALKEAEHRPYIHAHFPTWEDRILYWHVHDLDEADADQALPEIESQVGALVKELGDGGGSKRVDRNLER
jgi:protein-tyrosine phosphatase